MTFDPTQGTVTQRGSQEARETETDVSQEAQQDLAVDGFPGTGMEMAEAMVLLAFTVTDLDKPAKFVDEQDIEGRKVQVSTHQNEAMDNFTLGVEFFDENHLNYADVFHTHPTRQETIGSRATGDIRKVLWAPQIPQIRQIVDLAVSERIPASRPRRSKSNIKRNLTEDTPSGE